MRSVRAGPTLSLNSFFFSFLTEPAEGKSTESDALKNFNFKFNDNLSAANFLFGKGSVSGSKFNFGNNPQFGEQKPGQVQQVDLDNN